MVNRRRKMGRVKQKVESATCPGSHEGAAPAPRRMGRLGSGAGVPGTARPKTEAVRAGLQFSPTCSGQKNLRCQPSCDTAKPRKGTPTPQEKESACDTNRPADPATIWPRSLAACCRQASYPGKGSAQSARGVLREWRTPNASIKPQAHVCLRSLRASGRNLPVVEPD